MDHSEAISLLLDPAGVIEVSCAYEFLCVSYGVEHSWSVTHFYTATGLACAESYSTPAEGRRLLSIDIYDKEAL